jgi:hypothetical protein
LCFGCADVFILATSPSSNNEAPSEKAVAKFGCRVGEGRERVRLAWRHLDVVVRRSIKWWRRGVGVQKAAAAESSVAALGPFQPARGHWQPQPCYVVLSRHFTGNRAALSVIHQRPAYVVVLLLLQLLMCVRLGVWPLWGQGRALTDRGASHSSM